MTIYILLIFITFLFWKLSKLYPEKHNQLFIALCIIFIAVSALRFNVGTDYNNTYIKFLNRLKLGYGAHYEILFLLLNKIIIMLRLPNFMLLSICSIFTIPIFFIFIKRNLKKEYWFLGALLFELTTIFFATMNTVRQYMAIVFIIIGLEFLKEKKILPYIIFVLVACCFHKTAFLGFIYLFSLINDKNQKFQKVINIIYLLSLVFIIFDVKLLFNMFEKILPYKYLFQNIILTKRSYSSIIKILLPNILFIISTKDKKLIIKENKYFNIYYLALFVYTIIYNVFYGLDAFIRITYYFDFLLLAIIPIICDHLNKKNKIFNIKINNLGNIFLCMVVLYFSMLMTYGIFVKNGHGVMPYNTIFSKIGE